jgi:hypothetical protein
MKKLAVLLFFALLITNVQAQKIVGGEWSVGPRLGGSSGISLKKHMNSNSFAFEFIAANSFDKEVDGLSVSGLFEKLAPMNGNGQLSALFGAGFNLNFKNKTKFGLSGILGFDWRLKNVPVTLQVDWLPTWYFVNESYFSGVNAAFTARYVLNRKKFGMK